MHINFRHKVQLHIKTLITHLVVEKNVLTIENPWGSICFRKPTSEANSRPRTPFTQPFFLHRAECCGKNKRFLVEPYLAALRSAHRGLLDTEFRCIVPEQSSAWKTSPCLQLFSGVQTLETICTHSSRLEVEGLGCRSP